MGEEQDFYIRNRINRLFFLKQLEVVSKVNHVSDEERINLNDLPKNIRNKDSIINDLAHQYKEADLLQEPNLEDIYNEIDIAINKIGIKVIPDRLHNVDISKESTGLEKGVVREKIYDRRNLLWDRMNLEEVFDFGFYSQENLNAAKIS